MHLSPADFLRNVLVEYTVFPNTNLMWAIDHFEVYQVEPDGDRADSPGSGWPCSSIPTSGTVGSSGRRTSRSRGTSSCRRTSPPPSRSSGPYEGGAAPAELVFGRNEAPLQHYHRQLAAVLADEPAEVR